MKAIRKGKKSNGKNKYAVESHMSDKAVRNVKKQSRQLAKRIEKPDNAREEYKAINNYNAYVSGVHNYYQYATHISKDMRIIAFGLNRTLKNRLKERLQMQGNKLPIYIEKRYGKSKQMRFVNGQPLIPMGYIQTKAPLFLSRGVNQYTVLGRTMIHRRLENVNINILHYLVRNPLREESVELNNNRLALYCAQQGKCAVTKKPLEIGFIHCHHKTPRKQGGEDNYSNLVLVDDDVHTLIHSTTQETIQYYVSVLQLDIKQKEKINTLRKSANLFPI